MIYDSMKNFAAYRKLAPEAWEKVSAFLAGCTPETPAGRYELDGDRVYAMVQGYETHDADPDKLGNTSTSSFCSPARSRSSAAPSPV